MLIAIGFSTRALVQCAAREGLKAYSFDCCCDRDTRELAERAIVVDLADKEWLRALPPGGSIMIAGGLDDNLTLIEQLSRLDQQIYPEKFLQIRSRSNWDRWAARCGLRFPRTFSASEWVEMKRDAMSESLEPRPNDQWLWKKHGSGGGLGIQQIDVDPRTDTFGLPASMQNDSGIVQERITGQSLSISYLSSRHGTIPLGAAKSIDLNPHVWSDFIYRGSIAPINELDPWSMELQQFGNEVANDVKWQGLWQADFILRGSDLFLLEINPRWTATMELLAISLQLPIVTWHLQSPFVTREVWAGIESRMASRSSALISIYRKEILYAEQELTVSQEDAGYWWTNRWIAAKAQDTGPWFADIPLEDSRLPKGWPICSVITKLR